MPLIWFMLLLTPCTLFTPLALGADLSLAQLAEVVKPRASLITTRCCFILSDPQWPSSQQWAALNQSVGGRLIATIPIGAPCYKSTYNVKTEKYDHSTYDEAACEEVQEHWHETLLHEQSSSSVMQTYFANNSCNPIADQSEGKCGIGSYVQYAIDVPEDADVRAGLAFAEKNNIRLSFRNTGHESTNYDGPALKVQAGVRVGDVYDYLEKQGYMAIGGECPTLGQAGGYILAGGHAPTTSKLGLAADKILEIEGILASGESFTAAPDENQEIYWFLSGSGSAGTIAYIKSVIFKIFEDFPIDTWHNLTPNITDAGGYAYAFYKKGYFQIWPLFVPELSKEQTAALIQPFVDQLNGLKAYKALFPTLGAGTLQWSGRLIPRNIITLQPVTVSKTFQAIFDNGATMVEAIINPNFEVAKPLNNSVLPAWRTSIIDLVVGKPYNDSAPFRENADARTYITQHWTSALKQLAPASQGGGTYMNEADADDPNWQGKLLRRELPAAVGDQAEA